MSVTYPSDIMVVAAMNPCPCGYYGHPTKKCTCSPFVINRYMSKISGPLLDRFDLHIEVSSIEYNDIVSKEQAESSAKIKERVEKARQRQRDRFAEYSIQNNAKITTSMAKKFCVMTDDAEKILKMSFEKLGLSARAYDKILKTALTIADLNGDDVISTSHIANAVSYRSLDRKYWGRM